MVDTVNTTLFTKNFPKLNLNPLKPLKKLILSFYRRYYYPNATYLEIVFRKQVDKFIPFFVDISVTGMLLFLAIYGTYWIKMVWPLSSWRIAIAILILGLDSWLFTEYYVYLRKGYKGGKK